MFKRKKGEKKEEEEADGIRGVGSETSLSGAVDKRGKKLTFGKKLCQVRINKVTLGLYEKKRKPDFKI